MKIYEKRKYGYQRPNVIEIMKFKIIEFFKSRLIIHLPLPCLYYN